MGSQRLLHGRWEDASELAGLPDNGKNLAAFLAHVPKVARVQAIIGNSLMGEVGKPSFLDLRGSEQQR